MYHSFERIINDSMMVDDNGNEWIVNDDGWYDDRWIDADTDYPEDMQGEEDFA